MTASASAPDEPFFDLTGRPAAYDGKRPGRRISWEDFDDRTVRAVPLGAVSRSRRRAEKPEPLPRPEYWLDDRLCRFPMRWTDSRYRWHGWKVLPRPVVETPMQDLLRPLSAKATARHYRPAAPAPIQRTPRRLPIAEEAAAGRLSERHAMAAAWFFETLQGEPAALGAGQRRGHKPGGGDASQAKYRAPMWSRNPLALWPTEIAWDQYTRLRHRFRTLGPLAHVLLRALDGAEMRDLAPAWAIPQRHLAEAGRIRLRAALEVCARMQERGAERLLWREVVEIEKAACAECERLVSTRRMRSLRPDNDNVPIRKAA